MFTTTPVFKILCLLRLDVNTSQSIIIINIIQVFNNDEDNFKW